MYALFSAGLMFPMTVGITPLYLMIRNLGLSNSLAGIILPQIAFGLPQTIIILVPFLQSIPMELEEACLLDGLLSPRLLLAHGHPAFDARRRPRPASSPSWEAGTAICFRSSS